MRTFIVATTFIWVGLVLGISFLEAPLKFTAPGITLELGLGIGKVVFGALNKIEIGLCISILLSLLFAKFSLKSNSIYVLAFFVLIVQSAWLLPILEERAVGIINGQNVPDTNHHITYIILEVIKLVLLLTAGIRFANQKKQ